jgi:hypothetical protein
MTRRKIRRGGLKRETPGSDAGRFIFWIAIVATRPRN